MSDTKITDTAAKAELLARAEAIMAENNAPLPDEGDDDARLIEAERRFQISKQRRHALYDEFKSVFEDDDDIFATEKALIDVVDQIAPRTLAGAVAKLRVIIWNEDLELDRDPSLRQVMEILEAAVDAGDAVMSDKMRLVDLAEIDSAPVTPGQPFGPCLLASAAGDWTVGEWDGEGWFADAGSKFDPLFWALLPPLSALLGGPRQR